MHFEKVVAKYLLISQNCISGQVLNFAEQCRRGSNSIDTMQQATNFYY